jgi:hypothetical protein
MHFPEIDGKCQFFPVAVLPISTKVKSRDCWANKLISYRKTNLLMSNVVCFQKNTILKLDFFLAYEL